jgi:hypothetical protein
MLSLDPAVIDRSSPIPSERRLWAAVLRQAVCDLGYHRSTLQHFTQLWFESGNREPGSFLWVCELLELDSSWLRRRLLELAGKNPPVSMRVVHRPRQVKAVDPDRSTVLQETNSLIKSAALLNEGAQAGSLSPPGLTRLTA